MPVANRKVATAREPVDPKGDQTLTKGEPIIVNTEQEQNRDSGIHVTIDQLPPTADTSVISEENQPPQDQSDTTDNTTDPPQVDQNNMPGETKTIRKVRPRDCGR